MVSLRNVVSVFVFCLLAYPGVAANAATPEAQVTSAQADRPVQQLRIYQLYDNTKAAFLERFRDHAVPIMKRHGFDIVAMWESRHEGKPEFVYILRWESEARMKASWASFMADAEWSAIKKRTSAQHGPMVGTIQDRVLQPVLREERAAGS